MAGLVIRLMLAAIVFLMCAIAAAQPPESEPLPAPRAYTFRITPLPPEAYGSPIDAAFTPPPYQRTSAYAHWQMVGVNRQGFFRPLVVYTPDMPYYRYNGQPFPFATTHQRDFMPYIVDAPNR